MINKACPVVLRETRQGKEILAFCHPLAGKQIVKGTIEAGESLEHACQRELFEESGVRAESQTFLGEWDANYQDQVWGFFLMHRFGNLPDRWTHFTTDDGGLVFDFFWQGLSVPLGKDFHPVFKGAIDFINRALR